VKAPRKPDAVRAALMGRVRQKDTRPEQAVAAALRSCGAAYRKNVRGLPGSPDFADRSRKWAVFVHGCFWHRHTGCRRATTPKANRDFWLEKFQANRPATPGPSAPCGAGASESRSSGSAKARRPEGARQRSLNRVA